MYSVSLLLLGIVIVIFKLLYIEALANAGVKAEAKHAFNQLEKLPQDIADYFKTLIK